MVRRHAVFCWIVAVAAPFGPALVTAMPAHGAAAGARVVDVVRQYGDGPVVLSPGIDAARIRFSGRRSDRVTVRGGRYCPSELRGPDGSVLHREGSMFWRLPARGVYTIRYHRCRYAKGEVVSLQLTKLVVRRLVVDEALRMTRRTGYVQAAAVRVPATGRVQITPYDAEHSFAWPDLVLPDGRRHRRGSPHFTAIDLYLEAGIPLSAQDGPLPGLEDTPLVAGDRLLVLAWKGMTLRASTPVVRPVVLDGEAVQAGNGGVPFRETQLEFDGQGGQWVRLEQVGDLGLADTIYRYHLLIDPTGRVVTRPDWRFHPYWQLPVTGHYRLMVETGQKPAHATVRVRTVRQLAEPMPTDGSPLTFTATDPGEWVLASFDMAQGLGYRLHVASANVTGGWEAFTEPTDRFLCDWDGPIGCGDYSYGWVGPELADSYPFYGYHPDSWVVVLAMPPGQTGEVTLSLALQPASTSMSRGTALPRL